MLPCQFCFQFLVFVDKVLKMKNKISTFLTVLPDSTIQKQKNKKKRKEICSDPNEGKVLEIVEKVSKVKSLIKYYLH